MVQEGLNKPLYIQIQEYLAEKILTGNLQPDTRIQSEREISDDLGVSRMTVRKALTELVNEGLLERRHGSGTYVAKPKATYEIHETINFIETLRERNLSITSQLLSFEETVASRRLSESLNVEIGHPIYRISILRLANKMPAILEKLFIPMKRFPNLHEWDLEKTSIFDLITRIYQYEIGEINQTIEAILANELVAEQLRVNYGFPLLLITNTVNQKGTQIPLLYTLNSLRGDIARIKTDWAHRNKGLEAQPDKEVMDIRNHSSIGAEV